MRVVVLNDKRSERDAIARILGGSWAVECVGDAKGAVAAIAREAPQVLLFSWPDRGGADLLRLLRGSDASAQMYILVLLDSIGGAGDISLALASGAHDVIRRPIVAEEMVARIHAPTRLLEWARSVTGAAAFCAPAVADLSQLPIWQKVGDVVAADLGQMVGDGAKARRGWSKRPGQELRAASIAMSLPREHLELRASIVAEAPTLRWLGETLLGDPRADETALRDVLREMANTAGGAIKRAALPEGITLSTGMPKNECHVPAQGEGVQTWTLPLNGGKACLGIVCEIRTRKNHRVPAAELREGMVLVHDLRSETGTLLIPAGLRLTSTTAARVAELLGPRFLIEVAFAA